MLYIISLERIHLKTGSLYPLSDIVSISLNPQPLANTFLFPVAVSSALLDSPYK